MKIQAVIKETREKFIAYANEHGLKVRDPRYNSLMHSQAIGAALQMSDDGGLIKVTFYKDLAVQCYTKARDSKDPELTQLFEEWISTGKAHEDTGYTFTLGGGAAAIGPQPVPQAAAVDPQQAPPPPQATVDHDREEHLRRQVEELKAKHAAELANLQAERDVADAANKAKLAAERAENAQNAARVKKLQATLRETTDRLDRLGVNTADQGSEASGEPALDGRGQKRMRVENVVHLVANEETRPNGLVQRDPKRKNHGYTQEEIEEAAKRSKSNDFTIAANALVGIAKGILGIPSKKARVRD
jgi:type IV secretory pathway VirB10-like protein